MMTGVFHFMAISLAGVCARHPMLAAVPCQLEALPGRRPDTKPRLIMIIIKLSNSYSIPLATGSARSATRLHERGVDD
jgi:hypothetical protein